MRTHTNELPHMSYHPHCADVRAHSKVSFYPQQPASNFYVAQRNQTAITREMISIINKIQKPKIRQNIYTLYMTSLVYIYMTFYIQDVIYIQELSYNLLLHKGLQNSIENEKLPMYNKIAYLAIAKKNHEKIIYENEADVSFTWRKTSVHIARSVQVGKRSGCHP